MKTQAISINQQNSKQNQRKAPVFKGLPETFLAMQENLSYTRFFQDTVTNWVPKAVFTRGAADFTEMSFLEFSESALFYFAPALVGEYLSRRVLFSKFPKKLIKDNFLDETPKLKATINKGLAQSVEEIAKNEELVNNGLTKKILPLKAALVLSCVGIPAAEYALSFAKNLLTLKLFKKADFNNVANLNKDQKEDEEFQKKVEKSAKSHIKSAAVVSGLALATSFIFAGLGHKSKALQKISEYILEPGAKIYKGLEKTGIKSKKIENFLKTYVNFDFDSSGDKLALSKGQLAATVISGVFGYHAAAKDRGPLDEKEMLSRVPLVAFYTIFGSSIFDNIFKGILLKRNKFSDLIKKGEDGFENIPKTAQLKELAETIAAKSGKPVEKELKRLTKESAIIQAVPFGFTLAFMGFLLSGINRFWTQQRYNHLHKDNNKVENTFKNFLYEKPKTNAFNCFS